MSFRGRSPVLAVLTSGTYCESCPVPNHVNPPFRMPVFSVHPRAQSTEMSIYTGNML